MYVFVKAVYVRGIVSVYSIQGLKLRESQPFCKVIYRNLGVCALVWLIVMQACGVRDGVGPQTRRVVNINVVATPRPVLHGAPGSRGRGVRGGVDAATEAARAVAEPVGKPVYNPPAYMSTPSGQRRRAPPVPRFDAPGDTSKASSRAYDPARKLANRQALRDYHEQVRKGVASGEDIVVPLTTNASGMVILLRSKWQGAIRALAQNYLKWSERNFDEHVPELIASIDEKIRKKMFSYSPYPLAPTAVVDYLKSSMKHARSRWWRAWRLSGYDDTKIAVGCPPHVWKQCLRFWKSPEGQAISEKMVHVRSCVGNPSHSGNIPVTTLLMHTVIEHSFDA